MKHLGRKTRKSSNRLRAADKGQENMVRPGKRHEPQKRVIDSESAEEVYGVLLSEHRRMGESNPSVPEQKVKATQSNEPKRVPKTGIAKERSNE